MNLFDPLRPLSPLGQPTWLRAHIVVPKLELFPLKCGNIEVSVWLPIKGEGNFASKRYTTQIEPIFLAGLITNFTNDPEETCEYLFDTDLHPPELRPTHVAERSDAPCSGAIAPRNAKLNLNTKPSLINENDLVASF